MGKTFFKYMQYTEYTASMDADTQFEFASLQNMLAFIYAITQNTLYKLQHVGQPNISRFIPILTCKKRSE